MFLLCIIYNMSTKTIIIIIIAIIILIGGGVAFYFMYWKPHSEYNNLVNATIIILKTVNEDKSVKYDCFVGDDTKSAVQKALGLTDKFEYSDFKAKRDEYNSKLFTKDNLPDKAFELIHEDKAKTCEYKKIPNVPEPDKSGVLTEKFNVDETSQIELNAANLYPSQDPKQFLPPNSTYSDLTKNNFLNTGYHYQMNTTMSTMKNPDLQMGLRESLEVPVSNVGAWNLSSWQQYVPLKKTGW